MSLKSVVEGQSFVLAGQERDGLRRSAADLERKLRPSARILEERDGLCVIRGVVGTFAVGPQTSLEVTPKTDATGDWIGSVLDLILPANRVEIAGERKSGVTAHRNLLDALASIYAHRLLEALRREGPILLMVRREAVLPMLKGRLAVSAWARQAAWTPHRFPVSFQELSGDNDYSRGLAHVAALLARATSVPRTRGILLACARLLRPGAPEGFSASIQGTFRPLPSQWAAFQPAWEIALTVIARRSLLGATGRRYGFSLAVEAWPLLETLLQRVLRGVVTVARGENRALRAPTKHSTSLLVGLNAKSRSVEPDGRLTDVHGQHLATFEAKYSRIQPCDGPPREHYFQATATAAAAKSRLAVLVYPGAFEPLWWRTDAFNGSPGYVAAVGLDLFNYRRGSGEVERARAFLSLLDGPPRSAVLPIGTKP